jgi:hypothetical protein
MTSRHRHKHHYLRRLLLESLEDRTVLDNTYHALASGPLTQNWSNTSLISTNNNWSAVPSIIGYNGSGIVSGFDYPAQNVFGFNTVQDVSRNQTNPNTLTPGANGVAEFEIADPVVALAGSTTAKAPNLVFHVDTRGTAGVRIQMNLRDIESSADNAPQQIAIQQRVGESDPFDTIFSYSDVTVANGTMVTPVDLMLLPFGINQAQVQIRVITTDTSVTDEWVGIDDIVITGILPNAAPTVTLPGPALAYVENASPQLIQPLATVTDADSPNFDGGTLTASLTGATANDRLTILPQGSGAGEIDVSGSTITYQGTTIGTFSGGTGTTPLSVSLSGTAATPAAAQALLRRVAFNNVSENPSTAARTLSVVVSDGDGGTSQAASATINVAAVNDAPLLTINPAASDYSAGGPAQILDATAAIADVDATLFNNSTLTVSIASPQPGDALGIRSEGNGSGQVGVSGSTVSYEGTAIGAITNSAPLVVTFNSSATLAAVQAVLRNITFQNSLPTPTPGVRDLSFQYSEGDSTASLAAAAHVNVLAAIPSLTLADASIGEGNSGTRVLSFPITLSSAPAANVVVTYTTEDGTAATADGDYLAASSSLTFTPGGPLSQTIDITILGDTKFELTEQFVLKILSAPGATIARAQATGEIANDDSLPKISLAAPVAASESVAVRTFAVSLSNASAFPVIVSYATANGSATVADADYLAASGTLTFNPGEPLTQAINVTVTNDAKFELDEQFGVSLSAASSGTIDVGDATTSILNDDLRPTVSISAVSQMEGHAGQTAFVFDVTLSNPSYQAVSVDYAAADGTATLADNDYQAASGSLVFASGTTSLHQMIVVQVVGDQRIEPDEAFLIHATLTGALNSDLDATATILNDDFAAPVIIDANALGGNGNDNGQTDTFRLVRRNEFLDLYLDGALSNSYFLANVTEVRVNGSNDNDTLTIDFGGGYWQVGGGIHFTAGSAAGDVDLLQITGDPGFAFTSETYSAADGSWRLEPSAGNGATTVIDFTGLESAETDVTATAFDVVLGGSDDAARVANGGTLGAAAALQVASLSNTFASTRFTDKAALRVMGGPGADTLALDATVKAADLTTVEFYGHLAADLIGLPTDDGAADSFSVSASPLGVATRLYGNGGSDTFALGGAARTLDALLGAVEIHGGAGSDTATLDDAATATVDPLVTVTATNVQGLAPVSVTYDGLESLVIDSADNRATAIDVLSTALGTSTVLDLTHDSSPSVVTVGNRRSAFADGSGSVANLLGSLHVRAAKSATLQIDATGAVDNRSVVIDAIAGTTSIAGLGPAVISYATTAQDTLARLDLRLGSGNDEIDVKTTTATVATTLDAGPGDDAFFIAGDRLSANTTLRGGSGNDEFQITVANDLGGSLTISGDAHDAAHRDRVSIDDGSSVARDVTLQYTANGITITGGFAAPIALQTIETLLYSGGAVNSDAIHLLGSTSDDDFTIAQPLGSTLVFVGGAPEADLPGVSGGSTLPDIRFTGVQPLVSLSGGGSAQGNRLFYRGLSESALVEAGSTDFFGFGPGVLIPAAAVGAANDHLRVEESQVLDTQRQAGVLIDASTFAQADAARPALHILGGSESVVAADGTTDHFDAVNSTKFVIRIDGGATGGDAVSLTTSGDLTLYGDAAQIGVRSSAAAYPVLLESLELTQLQAATGIIHLLGDGGSGMAHADTIDIAISATAGTAQLMFNGEPISLSGATNIEIAGGQLADAVAVHATSANEQISIGAQNNNIVISGLAIALKILEPLASEGDTLLIDAQAGNDTLDASQLARGLVQLKLAGGTGNDTFVGSAGDDLLDGGAGYDMLLIQGTIAADNIDVEQSSAAALRININGAESIKTLVSNSLEELQIDAGAGSDTIQLQTVDALFATPGTALLVHVLGGSHTGSGDSLTIIDNGSDDLTILRPGTTGSGTITIGPRNAQPFAYLFDGVEQLQFVDENGAALNTIAGGSRLVVYPPEPTDLNNDLLTATPLALNNQLAARIEAGDSDFYRIDATATGTLDLQVRFAQIASILNSSRPGLPGDGNLSLELFDGTGARIVPIAPFGANDNDDHERIRIPAVAGETYYIRVFGATATASNGYSVLALNDAVDAPHDLALAGAGGLTNDAKPRVVLQFNDNALLNDTLPLFDETIPIPFQGATLAAGFRIGVFEGSTLLGYATVTATPGVYEFEAPALGDGPHLLYARAEIIDPALQTAYSPPSATFHFTIDSTPPALFNFGLRADSDSGVSGLPETFTDRITSITLPSFSGSAEVSSQVRLYRDSNFNGSLDIADALLGEATASLAGQWQATALAQLPAGLNRIFATAIDAAGNVSQPATFEFFIDTQAPSVTSVSITGAPIYNLTNPHAVTPPANSLSIRVRDLGNRAGSFLQNALIEQKATNVANYALRGDFSGPITIQSVQVQPLVVVSGQPAEADIILHFASPLPDDRFTLDFANVLFDAAGNAGAAYSTRFTIDSRAEIGTWAGGSVWVDTNGNGLWDPRTPTDLTNRDIAYALGGASDTVFAGNFAILDNLGADGFDKLATYGLGPSGYRFLIDADNDGAPDNDPGVFPAVNGVTILNIAGQPIAGRFDASDNNGDEVGVFSGVTWYFDTNHNYVIDSGDATLVSALRGQAIVGDFDGDGFDDLATWQNDRFQFDLTKGTRRGWDGVIDWEVSFGFSSANERAVAADMDADGIDDVALWVPDLLAPQAAADWYFIVSGGEAIVDAALAADAPGQRVVSDPDSGAPVFQFSPEPFHRDLHFSHGNAQALPIVGNFDPPATATPGVALGKYSNGLDVDGDGKVTPVDAVLIINSLNADGVRTLTSKSLSVNGPFVDVNGDRQLTPLDALLVINHLNSVGSSEGEASPSPPSTLKDDADFDLLLALLADDTAQQSQKRPAFRL